MYRIVVPLVLLALAAAAFVVGNRTRPAETASGRGEEVLEARPLLDAGRIRFADGANGGASQPSEVSRVTSEEDSNEREGTFVGLPEEIPQLGGPDIDELTDRLNEIIERLPSGYRTCFVVRERTSSEDSRSEQLGDIFSHHSELSLVPASNLKLATAAAALLQLGADYRLTTRVLASRLPTGGDLHGDLYLIGGGDPLLYTSDYLATFVRFPSVYTQIEDLARQVYDRGLRRVYGSIVGVATRYDNRRIASQLMSEESYQYVGPLSALLINDGYTNYAERRDLGTSPTPAQDPTLFTAAEFDDLLEDLDMVITRRPRVAGPDENIRGFIEIARIESAPLSELLLSLLTDSDNTTAELLVKEIASNRAVAELLAQQPEERVLELPEEEEPENEITDAAEDGSDATREESPARIQATEESSEEENANPQGTIQQSSAAPTSAQGRIRLIQADDTESQEPQLVIDLSGGPEVESEEEGTVEEGSPGESPSTPESSVPTDDESTAEELSAELPAEGEEGEEEPERVIPPHEDPEVTPLTAEPGSTQAGVEAVAQILTDNGINSWVGIPRDGSGLDNRNLMNCAAAADILDFFGPQSDFSKALAKAAETGTLQDRFANTSLVGRLRAKTGSLPGATTLSGFIDAGENRSLTFSFFINHGFTAADDERALRIQREAMLALVDYLDG